MQGVKQDFVALTTLRAIGALCVVEHHAWHFVFPAWSNNWIVWGFQLWPDYFFILSGFILTHVYGTSLRAGSGKDIYNYFVHRVARVYPLHVVVLFMLVGFEALRLLAAHFHHAEATGRYFVDSTSPKYILTNLLLIQAWGVQHINSWNMPAWSVSAEFACYLAFPLMLKWDLAAKPMRAALLVIFSVAGLCWIQLTRHTFDVTYDLGVPRAFFSFSIGCVLYQYRNRLLGYLSFIPPALLQGSILAAVIVAYAANVPGIVYIPLWVLLIAAMTHEKAMIARALSWSPLVALGERSYSIYMTHVLVLWIMLMIKATAPQAFDTFLQLPPVLILAVVLGSTIVISIFTYRHVESPGRSFIRKHLDIRSEKKPSPPADDEAVRLALFQRKAET